MRVISVTLLTLTFFVTVRAQTYNCRRLEDCQNGATCETAGTCTCTNPANTYYNCLHDTTTGLCTGEELTCLNGGTCLTDGTTPVCACPFGFYGATCDLSNVKINCGGNTVEYVLAFPSTFSGTVALDADPSATDAAACTFASADDVTNTVKTFSLTFDVDPATTGSGNCPAGYLNTEKDVATSTDRYTGSLRVNYLAGLTTSLDELYNLTCEHAPGNINTYQSVSNVQFTSEDHLDNVIKNETYSPVDIAMLKTDGTALDTGTTPLYVGDSFKVALYLTDTTGYTSIRIESCEANNTLADPDSKLYKFFDNGCPTTIGKRIAEEQVGEQVTINGQPNTASTVTLQAFKFVDSQNLGLTCVAKICKTAEDCAAPADCEAVRNPPPTEAPAPPEGRRKRREATEEDDKTTVTTFLTVLNPGETIQQPSTGNEQKFNVENCLQETSILTMLIVLASVVCILLIAAFVLACVVLRRRGQKPKFENMDGRRSDRFHIPRAHVNDSYTRDI